ncbi:MAG TPA: hypothetical protein VKP30_28435, partial [Polyangiaceae bacterium]|nr:hypothetical protein [Polyangiaceae bacterium]
CALRALLAAASTVAVRGKLHFVHLSTPGRPNPNFAARIPSTPHLGSTHHFKRFGILARLT